MYDGYPTPAKRLKAATDKLEAGIVDLFESQRFTDYLRTMSKFHRYSFGNVLLIMMQCPGASQVAGFHDWKKKFGRSVKKGEKGITILAPCPYRRWEEVAETRPDGEEVKSARLVERRSYRTVTVFDVSQTEGKALPALTTELTGTVEQYEALTAALGKLSPVPIVFDQVPGTAKGYFSSREGRIVIRPGMSQTQTLKTMVHETAHAKLHALPVENGAVIGQQEKDRRTREVEAESVAYVVCQHFGVDTSEYTFGYVAGWSRGKELPELKASLDCIRATAAELIDGMESREKELVPPRQEKIARHRPTKQRAVPTR